jgi:REP element-mobilizing transposase RayT
MPRPLRPDEADAVHHITARGVEKRSIYMDDLDRQRFIVGLTKATRERDWRCLAYCLMGNHFHLLIRTPEPTLSAGMRDLNGQYARAFNRRHGRRGHLFEERYHSSRILRESHLREAVRYIAMNPVRAGLCAAPGDWPWSSHAALVGAVPAPSVLAVEDVLGLFDPDGRTGYCEFIAGARPT